MIKDNNLFLKLDPCFGRGLSFLSALFILIPIILSGCSSKAEPEKKTDFVLDTVATIAIYDKRSDADELLQSSFDEIRRYEKLFSAEIEGSDIWRINHSKGKETSVSPETAELIGIALKYSELSEGAFDITIRPVSKLWDFKSENRRPPEKEDIEEALKHVGYDKLELNMENNTVKLSDPEAGIELGGIAKGYIGDRIKDFLKDRGVGSAIINLGGNVVLIGSKPDGSPFRVGIEKPFSEGEMSEELEVSDVSVVTSGNYERYFYYEDRLYHHILDTSTGYPADKGINGVTIVSGRSVEGDALSTALFCLGKEKGTELINKLGDEGIKVYYVTD